MQKVASSNLIEYNFIASALVMYLVTFAQGQPQELEIQKITH